MMVRNCCFWSCWLDFSALMVAEVVPGHSHHVSWLLYQAVPMFRFTFEHEYVLQSSAGGPPPLLLANVKVNDIKGKTQALTLHLRYHTTSTNHRLPSPDNVPQWWSHLLLLPPSAHNLQFPLHCLC